jgi:rRNA-processing protein FCF1
MEHPTPWQEDILEKVGRFEGVVIGPVYGELKRLDERRGRQSGFARLALGLVEGGALRLDASGGVRADEELVSYALREGAAVATIDGALIKQLEASHIEVLSLSGGRVDLRQH